MGVFFSSHFYLNKPWLLCSVANMAFSLGGYLPRRDIIASRIQERLKDTWYTLNKESSIFPSDNRVHANHCIETKKRFTQQRCLCYVMIIAIQQPSNLRARVFISYCSISGNSKLWKIYCQSVSRVTKNVTCADVASNLAVANGKSSHSSSTLFGRRLCHL